jgi:hypothetical protein
MRQFPEISESFREFIEKQKIFFVGAAGPDWISHRRGAEDAEESLAKRFSLAKAPRRQV